MLQHYWVKAWTWVMLNCSAACMAWRKKLASVRHVTDYLQKLKRYRIKLFTLTAGDEISHLLSMKILPQHWYFICHWWHITSSTVNINGKPKCLNDHYPRFTLPILRTFQSVSKFHFSCPWARKRLQVTCLPQEILNYRNEWFDTSSDVNVPVLDVMCWVNS